MLSIERNCKFSIFRRILFVCIFQTEHFLLIQYKRKPNFFYFGKNTCIKCLKREINIFIDIFLTCQTKIIFRFHKAVAISSTVKLRRPCSLTFIFNSSYLIGKQNFWNQLEQFDCTWELLIQVGEEVLLSFDHNCKKWN